MGDIGEWANAAYEAASEVGGKNEGGPASGPGEGGFP